MLSLRSAVRTRHIRSAAIRLGLLCGAAIVLGFLAFIWLLPSEEVVLNHNADGIVVLTGGTSRVTDALELLATGRGKRLLITGVNPGTTTADIAHQVADYGRVLACCVDLDYSALNTLGNAVQTRRWTKPQTLDLTPPPTRTKATNWRTMIIGTTWRLPNIPLRWPVTSTPGRSWTLGRMATTPHLPNKTVRTPKRTNPTMRSCPSRALRFMLPT